MISPHLHIFVISFYYIKKVLYVAFFDITYQDVKFPCARKMIDSICIVSVNVSLNLAETEL
ncbi:MAG TPA: hypothetical protein DCG51_08125 [Erysipelotrichaceae bacterium]|nr:hypothetical protein [Erysipelotrichaceae bacterium]